MTHWNLLLGTWIFWQKFHIFSCILICLTMTVDKMLYWFLFSLFTCGKKTAVSGLICYRDREEIHLPVKGAHWVDIVYFVGATKYHEICEPAQWASLKRRGVQRRLITCTKVEIFCSRWTGPTILFLSLCLKMCWLFNHKWQFSAGSLNHHFVLFWMLGGNHPSTNGCSNISGGTNLRMHSLLAFIASSTFFEPKWKGRKE